MYHFNFDVFVNCSIIIYSLTDHYYQTSHYIICIHKCLFFFSGEIFLVRPLDEISAITHVGDPVLLTVIAEEVKVLKDEPAAMATTVQLAFFLPERSNSPPYFENDQYVL